MSFFIEHLHLNFHSLLGFQYGSGSSIKAIMPLPATLPLAIGLKFFWFLLALLLFPKSVILAILGLSFLDPKDLCLPNWFSRGFWQKPSASIYLTWCQRKNRYIILATIWTFSDQHLLKSFLGVTEQNSSSLGKTL